MAVNKDEYFILTEIFTKMKYDKLNERYVISLEDYSHLNLTAKQKETLKKMCKENDIYLEAFPRQLTSRETTELLEEYINIKQLLENKPNVPNKKDLDKRKKEIRNKIAEGHMKFIYDFINKHLPETRDMQDKEDIYQIGYMTLLEFIDKYDPSKNSSFIYFVNNYILYYMMLNIYNTYGDIKNNQMNKLQKIKRIRKKIGHNASIEALAKEMNVSTETVKNIIRLEELMKPTTLNIKEQETPNDLIDYDFEERTVDRIIEEGNYITKLIEMLPETHQKVIKLYYGFEDGKTYNGTEIAKKLGLTSRERIRNMRENSLQILANSIGSKYLTELHGATPYTTYNKEEIALLSKTNTITEDILITLINPTNLLSIIDTFEQEEKEIILLYYGLVDGVSYDCREISKILNKKETRIKKQRNQIVKKLIKCIVKKMNPEIKNNYLEYLLNAYLSTPRRKNK